ncbi:MAG: hypothetical protein JKY23_04270 [Nitrospinaceae bacterium]|nr:hypothetical protein [Nitrospinaceae bacterium]
MRGVKPTAAALFYPAWSFKSATNGSLKSVDATCSVTGSDKSLTGLELGQCVDRQLGDIVKLLVGYSVPLALFLDQEMKLPASLPKRALHALLGYRQTMHVYSRKVFAVLASQGLEPLATQVCCGSCDARLGTAVDLVCRDPRPPFHDVLVEIKAGYYRYMNRFVTHMSPPYQAFPDSPFYQFQLQLAFTRILYMRTYQHRMVSYSVVLNVHEQGIDLYSLLPAVQKCDVGAWKVLVNTRDLTAPQRTAMHNRARAQYLEQKGSVPKPSKVNPATAAVAAIRKPRARKVAKGRKRPRSLPVNRMVATTRRLSRGKLKVTRRRTRSARSATRRRKVTK